MKYSSILKYITNTFYRSVIGKLDTFDKSKDLIVTYVFVNPNPNGKHSRVAVAIKKTDLSGPLGSLRSLGRASLEFVLCSMDVMVEKPATKKRLERSYPVLLVAQYPKVLED